MIRFDVLSIFPEMFLSPLSFSLLKKAQDKGLLKVCLHDIRNWTSDKHRMTDDAPFGGGCGMVMKVEACGKERLPRLKAVWEILKLFWSHRKAKHLNHKIATDLASETQIIIICGRYEGG